MKPELLSAWRSLDAAIDEVLDAKPAQLSKAATDLATARQVYGEMFLGENTVKSSLYSSMVTHAVGYWRSFRDFFKKQEERWKKSLLRTTVNLIFFVAVCGFVFNALYGSSVSQGYMVTAFGLILVAFSQLLKHKVLQDLATLIGVALVGWWYIHTLPGVFNNVPNLMLDSDPQQSGYHVIVQVEDGKEVCSFDSAAKLNCKVWVAPIVPAATKN